MPSKSISITEDVYNLLSKFKLKNESFSQAIKRLVEYNLDIIDLAGGWKKIPDAKHAIELIEKIVKEINEGTLEKLA